ncbi:MAG: septum formation protein [Myxococcota bacterium]|jgi:septum formation protein
MSENKIPTLVLASASPRRRDLLARINASFEVLPSDIPEESRPGEEPFEMATRLAGEKALAVAERLEATDDRWVLGADTIVVIGGQVLGKPTDTANAEYLLGLILGHTHSVITGFAWVHSQLRVIHTQWVESRVCMREASATEIRDYVATGEPMDKAGAYALQGEGAKFVLDVEGSRENVIGLPTHEVLEMWESLRASHAAEMADDTTETSP